MYSSSTRVLFVSAAMAPPPAAASSSPVRRGVPLPLTILALVLVSATFHTLIRSNLQSSLHIALQPTSLEPVLDYISGASAADTSASARVSLVLAEAAVRPDSTSDWREVPLAPSGLPPAAAVSAAAEACCEVKRRRTSRMSRVGRCPCTVAGGGLGLQACAQAL